MDKEQTLRLSEIELEHKREQNRQKYAKRPRSYFVEYHRKMRAKVVQELGGVCAQCGFSDVRALQVDHVNGGGCAARKNGNGTNHGTTHYRKVIQSFKDGEGKFQLLCANCNWIKGRCTDNS